MADFASGTQAFADTVRTHLWLAQLEALGNDDEPAFDRLALEAFRYQVSNGEVYGDYAGALRVSAPATWKEIPALPVGAFKLGPPVTTFAPSDSVAVFESSGTGDGPPARHFVRDLELYHHLSTLHFARVFGPGPFTLVGHLPGYTEKAGRSSLISMVSDLMRRFGDEASGFFLDDVEVLERACRSAQESGHTLILFGAAFGLLDLADQEIVRLPQNSWVIETGGMKTRRREVDRKTLHAGLGLGFGLPVSRIRSEYGMCELMSQAYSQPQGAFLPPPWMRYRVVDPEDPFHEVEEGRPGILAVCDLANLFTVSMLLTEDLAVANEGGFEVLGRLPGSALRGCNALLERTWDNDGRK